MSNARSQRRKVYARQGDGEREEEEEEEEAEAKEALGPPRGTRHGGLETSRLRVGDGPHEIKRENEPMGLVLVNRERLLHAWGLGLGVGSHQVSHTKPQAVACRRGGGGVTTHVATNTFNG